MEVQFSDGGEFLLVTPADRITPETRSLIREHKPALIDWFCTPRPPEPPVVEPWPPSGTPTPADWANHYEAVFQAQQQAVVARMNRRPRKDPDGWPPNRNNERTDS